MILILLIIIINIKKYVLNHYSINKTIENFLCVLL